MLVLRERRRRARRVRAVGYALIMLGWWAALYVGYSGPAISPLRGLALFLHLAALTIGLGAAVMVEYAGGLWVIGHGSLRSLLDAEERLAVPAWIGYAGLLVSGAMLSPDPHSPATAMKLAAVLVVGMNGIAVQKLTTELDRLPPDTPFGRAPRRLRVWSIASGALSQAAWWTAVLVGTLNTAAHAPS
ncbi:MAG: hypothetical protein JST33_06630 [Actinobacteria bacterium]|nr:hypothetical protein [Actinomycetota bacterium]